MDKSEKIIIFVVIGVVAGCVLIALACGGIFYAGQKFVDSDAIKTDFQITIEPFSESESESEPSDVCTAGSQATVNSIETDSERVADSEETLQFLENTMIPIADLNELAKKFNGKTEIATHLDSEPVDYSIGDRIYFYKVDENDENILTSATLRYETDNAYFWAEDDIETDKRELKTLMDTFSNEIYPTDQEFFGTEWIPGVDNDPHLYILYASGLGDYLAGYASSADGVLPEAHEYSNVKEMFTMNSDTLELSEEYTLSVMAHELQHVIHGYHDSNEELWLNEGFSELATLLNGYDAGGFDIEFINDPDMQLNNWSDDSDLSNSNYGASFLYTTYLLDRFGEDVTRAVVADPMNGFASVDNVLTAKNITDPLTGERITADDFFTDWTLANYLGDSSILDGRYSYSNYAGAPQASVTETFYDCTGVPQIRTVHQYGTDYYEIGCGGDVELQFTGDATVEALPESADNGGYMMWSNRADSSDMMLTRDFDFSSLSGNIQMSYDVWYDLENDYDYVYLMAQVDGGNWQIVDTSLCTTLDPSGNSYGCGYNAQSDGWQTESVDLSQFAGKQVSLRFEYVTDGAINYEGFAVDNISIPAVNYSEDFEADDGGWTRDGFVRMQNIVPQTFLVSLITEGSENPIQKFIVNPGEKLTLDINSACYSTNPILVVSGSSRYTRQMATYTLELNQK